MSSNRRSVQINIVAICVNRQIENLRSSRSVSIENTHRGYIVWGYGRLEASFYERMQI